MDLVKLGSNNALHDLGLEKNAFIGGLISKPLAALGRGITRKVFESGTPGVGKFMLRTGRGVAREATGMGLVGGGIGALTAEPGERISGALKGFGMGALGGASWRAGGNLARMGLKKTIGPQAYSKMFRSANTPFFNKVGPTAWYNPFKGYQWNKNITWGNVGNKAALGTVGLAGGMAAS